MKPRRAWWFRQGYYWTHLCAPGVSPAWITTHGRGRYEEGDCICEQLWSEREGLT